MYCCANDRVKRGRLDFFAEREHTRGWTLWRKGEMTSAQRAIVEMEEAKRNRRRCVFTSREAIDAVVDASNIRWCRIVPEAEGDHIIEDTSVGGKVVRTGVIVLTAGEEEVHRLQSVV